MQESAIFFLLKISLLPFCTFPKKHPSWHSQAPLNQSKRWALKHRARTQNVLRLTTNALKCLLQLTVDGWQLTTNAFYSVKCTPFKIQQEIHWLFLSNPRYFNVSICLFFGCFGVSFLGNICINQTCSFDEYFEKGFKDLVKAIKVDRFDAESLTKSLQVFELLWQYQRKLGKKNTDPFFLAFVAISEKTWPKAEQQMWVLEYNNKT